jgi:hypothetical protein
LRGSSVEEQAQLRAKIDYHYQQVMDCEKDYSGIRANVYVDRMNSRTLAKGMWPEARETLYRAAKQFPSFRQTLWNALVKYQPGLPAFRYWRQRFPDNNPHDLCENAKVLAQWDIFSEVTQELDSKISLLKRCHCPHVLEAELEGLCVDHLPERKMRRVDDQS